MEEENSWLESLRLSPSILTHLDIGREIYLRQGGINSKISGKDCYLCGYDTIKETISVFHMPEYKPSAGIPLNFRSNLITFKDVEDDYKNKLNNKLTQEDTIKNNMANKADSKLVLKGLDDKTVINCLTQEEADKVTALAEESGLTWINGTQYSTGNKWSVRGAKTCYFLNEGLVHSIDYFKNEGYKIITAKAFIDENTKPKVPNVKLTPEQFKFNMDRLAKETDTIVKGQLKEAENSFKGVADGVALEVLSELKQTVTIVRDKIEDEFKADIAKTLKDSKELLLEELRKGRTTINVMGENPITYSVSTDDHYMMETVFKSLLLHKKIMMAGEAGTGKTYMAAQMAQKLNLNFYKYSCSRDSSVHDLLGYKQPRSEEYLNTTFLTAYENGGVFLVDEYDAMPGDVALFFNGIADSSKSISIPHRDVNPIAKKHKDFYLVMCGNTWGKGSQDYSGRDFQDMALLDRFRLCRHHIGYDANLEKSMLGETMYPFAIELRNLLTKLGSYLSTRNVEDISLLLGSGETMEHILNTMAADLEATDKQEFERANLAGAHRQRYDKYVTELNDKRKAVK